MKCVKTFLFFFLNATGLHIISWENAAVTSLFTFVELKKTGDVKTDTFLAGLMRPGK